ncbi:MAG: DUF302 domain-containing protein [Betaproteobacteria bacterium]|nr:MAG: DUF302 domain-containing protein [Betaproteobacteria bacterium]
MGGQVKALAACFAVLAALAPATIAVAQAPSGMRVLATQHSFERLLGRVEQAVEKNRLGVIATASASRGAAARGVRIPGNAVVMVFRNDLAVRLLAASVPAGIEAPLRLYVTANADRTATLSYRAPSAVFAPYRHPEIERLAHELDPLMEQIAKDAAGG